MTHYLTLFQSLRNLLYDLSSVYGAWYIITGKKLGITSCVDRQSRILCLTYGAAAAVARF